MADTKILDATGLARVWTKIKEQMPFTDVTAFPTTDFKEATIYRKVTSNRLGTYDVDGVIFVDVTSAGVVWDTGEVTSWADVNANPAIYTASFVATTNGRITQYTDADGNPAYIDSASFILQSSAEFKCAKDGVLYEFGGSGSSSVTVDESTLTKSTDDVLSVKDLGVTTDKLADDAVTIDKVASTAISTAVSDTSTDNELSTARAVYNALDTRVATANLVTEFQTTPDNNHVPTELLVHTLFAAMSGAVTAKVVEELPATPVNNTLYYVGTASPYHIYLRAESTTYDMGTTEIDLSNYVPKTDIVDNLTTEDATKALSANQGTKLLPLAGGTMTGNIVVDAFAGIAMFRKVNDAELSIWGGNSVDNSMLQLAGKENSYYQGAFLLTANNGTTSAQLRGNSDGSITWNDGQLQSNTNGLQIKVASSTSGYTIASLVALGADNSRFFAPGIQFTAAEAPDGKADYTYDTQVEKYSSVFYKVTAYSFSTGITWTYTCVLGTVSGWKKSNAFVTKYTGELYNMSCTSLVAMLEEDNDDAVFCNVTFTNGEGPFTDCTGNVEVKKLTVAGSLLYTIELYPYNTDTQYIRQYDGYTWGSWRKHNIYG